MFPLMQSDGGRGRGAVRRIMAALGGLLALALVVSTLGLIRPSVGYAAPVEGSEPYTIDLEYLDHQSHPDGITCDVRDTDKGFCSASDARNERKREIAHLLVNTENYPKKPGPLTVVLRAPRSAVAEITAPKDIGGNADGSAGPTAAPGSQTIKGVDSTTLTISWEKFDAVKTSELDVPISFRLQDDLPNGTPFSLSAEATPGTAAQEADPPSLTFAARYQQQAGVIVRNSGSVQQGGRPTVIGAPHSGANGHLPSDISSLTPTSVSLQVPSLVGAEGVRTAESAKLEWKLPEYDTTNGRRRPLVKLPENSGWTISPDGSTATRTFAVPAGTDESQYNAVLKREIEAAELSMYFPGIKDPSSSNDLSGSNSLFATITYTPFQPAEDEQPVVASTSTGLRVTSVENDGVGTVDEQTGENGWQSSYSLSDTEGNRKRDVSWRLHYANTSGLPVHHLVIADELPHDDGTLKLVGFRGLTVEGFDPSKPGCQSVNPNDALQSQCQGDITNVDLIQVRAYTDATHSDTYAGSQLTMAKDGIGVRFDPAKTYVRFEIRLINGNGSDYVIPVQTDITLMPITQFRDSEHPAYQDPPATNVHYNNAAASGQFQLDGKTVSALIVKPGETPYINVTKFSEWLDLRSNAGGHGAKYGNQPLAVVGRQYRHSFDVSANIDDSKDWSSAKIIILLPTSFIPNGVADSTKNYDNIRPIVGSGAYFGPNDGELIRTISYRHNYAGGRNALIVSLKPDGLKKLQFQDRNYYGRKQMWGYLDGTIDSHALEGNTGTFDECFTADVAPAQSDDDTVPDDYHFGPNPNIVHSSFTYLIVNGNSGGSLFFDKTVSAFKDGNAGVDVGIVPDKEFYYRLILGNTRDSDTGKVTFVDGLPAVGDRTPQGGESREMDDGWKTRFPVRLSGPITARIGVVSGTGGSGTATNVTVEYTTAADASSLTMDQMSSLRWQPASDFGDGSGRIPWSQVTGFRVVCQNVPAHNALVLTVPAVVSKHDADAASAADSLAQSGVPTDRQKTEFGLVDTRDGGISDHRVVAVNMAGRELNGSGSGTGTGAGRIKQSNPAAVSLTRGGFVIRKTDASDTDRNLAGASFTLTGSGETSGVNLSATTDATGTATFLGLPDGTYTLTETRSPSGYLRASAPMTVRVEHKPEPQQGVEGSTEESVSVTMTGDVSGKGTAADPYLIADQQAPTSLPKAGGTGVAMVLTAVVALVALGLLVALLVRAASRARHPRG